MINFLIFLKVIYPSEYAWLESYLDSDFLWLENVVNWEDAFSLVLSDFTIYTFLSTPFFSNSHFFLDSFTKLSFVDILFIAETKKSKYSRELYDLFIWDISTTFFTKFFPLQFFFYTDYQDFIVILLKYSPELVTAIEDYVDIYWLNSALNYLPSVVFDLFHDSVVSSIADFLEYLALFFVFVWLVVILISIFNLLKWNNSLETYGVRLYYYLYSISKESRTQFEALIQTFFFFFFTEVWWFLLLTTIKKN